MQQLLLPSKYGIDPLAEKVCSCSFIFHFLPHPCPRQPLRCHKNFVFFRILLKWNHIVHRGKESTCQCRRCGFHPYIRKILWRRKGQPTPVFLPGTSHGQRSLAGYSLCGHKELDMIGDQITTTTYLIGIIEGQK